MPEDTGHEGMARVDTIPRHILQKKGNLKQCQNYRTISLTSHSSEIMLRVILSRLKAKAENCWQKNKQVLDQHGAQWNRSSIVDHHTEARYSSFNTDEGLVQAIQALYENSSGAVILNS